MRSIDYLVHIADVLSTEDMVVIPGFGGFISKYRSASINNMTGSIEPPAKYIAFNTQLDQSDNTFAKYLDENTLIEFSPRSYDGFVEELKTTLANNDIIQIPRVGRLYQDYDDVVHFLPESENLNTETFGLPAFHYVPRKRIVEITGNTPKIKPTIRTSSVLRLATAASVILLVGMLSWIGFKYAGTNNFASNSDSELIESNENNRTSELSILDALKDVPKESVVVDDEALSKSEIPITTEPKKVPLNSNIIMVGAFGQLENVIKMEKRISDLGYTIYRDQVRNLTRVGIEVSYNTKDDLDDVLKNVRNRLSSNAWLLK